ncbi:hypothetical protein MTP99_000089 [Tenebrio molitor]|nr:hypothetical protein MTP99_000089 [Tenebrio molitor]
MFAQSIVGIDRTFVRLCLALITRRKRADNGSVAVFIAGRHSGTENANGFCCYLVEAIVQLTAEERQLFAGCWHLDGGNTQDNTYCSTPQITHLRNESIQGTI